MCLCLLEYLDTCFLNEAFSTSFRANDPAGYKSSSIHPLVELNAYQLTGEFEKVLENEAGSLYQKMIISIFEQLTMI